VQAYLEFLRTQELAAATRAKKLTVIKGLVRTLSIEGVFPFAEGQKILSVKAPRVSRDGRTPGLSLDEARRLLDAPPPDTLRGIRDRALLSLLLHTGARRNAVCGIRIGHLLHEMGVHYVLLHEKGDRQIRAPLHPHPSERIRLWLEACGTDESAPHTYLFRPFNKRGGQLQDKPLHPYMVWYLVKKYARAAGLQVDRLDERGICAHSTRVTAITASFEGGAKLEEIQQLVGHKDPRNTLRYRRNSPKDAANAVMRINY
jgi:integrase